eukprot:gene216-310_t
MVKLGSAAPSAAAASAGSAAASAPDAAKPTSGPVFGELSGDVDCAASRGIPLPRCVDEKFNPVTGLTESNLDKCTHVLLGHFMREKRIWPYDFGLYVKREEALQKLK